MTSEPSQLWFALLGLIFLHEISSVRPLKTRVPSLKTWIVLDGNNRLSVQVSAEVTHSGLELNRCLLVAGRLKDNRFVQPSTQTFIHRCPRQSLSCSRTLRHGSPSDSFDGQSIPGAFRCMEKEWERNTPVPDTQTPGRRRHLRGLRIAIHFLLGQCGDKRESTSARELAGLRPTICGFYGKLCAFC